MTLRFSLREHKTTYPWVPFITFIKASATIIRTVSTTLSLGSGYMFIVVPRAWLNDKYIRWNWQGYGSLIRTPHHLLIYDGSYDRSSDIDFPTDSGLLLKGNGLLQTLSNQSSVFGPMTEDVQVDVSGGSETTCTIMFKLGDGWVQYNFWQQIDWFEINTGAGGVGTLFSEHFTDAVTMEKTGTYGDYGYISTGIVEPHENLLGKLAVRQEASINLHAIFRVGQGSIDLPVAFTVGQGSIDLPMAFTVKQWREDLFGKLIAQHSAWKRLPGEFIVRYSDWKRFPAGFWVLQWQEDLLGEFIVRQPGSSDLLGECIIRHANYVEQKAGFWVLYYGADLLGNIYIRPEGSTLTDFQIKDLTRGLTIHDPDRTMMVTPQRKMRVK